MAFIRHEKDGIVYFTIESFERTGLVRHCFSTRIGGVSSGRVKGLNLGFSRPDSRDSVMENFRLICSAVGFELNNLVFTRQVHSSTVLRVGQSDRGKGITKENDFSDVDGFVTDERDVVLTTFYADCVPLFFLDTEKASIGLAHAGWRGTVAGIAKETIKLMMKEFDSVPRNILVGIGPSICRNCYEVDEPVVKRLKETLECWRDVVVYTGKGKYLFDLQRTNRLILINSGVPDENITESEMCTKCNADLFYSFRREKENTGSLAALMQLL
ncbi:MAG: Multicopper polyphenol oxidase [Firmicutes bacterium]|nr:Multicopper polyphenol oxidase [Bacillota bacterium]MDI6706538.1 peptidoglycan editing factor PgeF [Bacillota bacterium]